jgi:hypothetical protein
MTQDELKLVFDALKQCNTYAFAGGLGLRATAHTDALAILEKALAELEGQDHIEQHLEMVKQKHKNNIWAKQLSAAQRNELSQIEDDTWEADRNG